MTNRISIGAEVMEDARSAMPAASDAVAGVMGIKSHSPGADPRTGGQTDESILKSAALQTAILNSANFSSIATDARGVIQIFNIGAERMLGYAAADVINSITPADLSDPEELIVRAQTLSSEAGSPIAPGFEALVFKASRGIEDIYPLTYIRKDGSRFPAMLSVTALRDTEGAIIGYLLIGTDDSARKQVEEQQKRTDQRLRDQQFYTRSLIESNIDGLITTDADGFITDVNRQMETLTGSTRDELIGAPFKDCFTDPERAEAGIHRMLLEKSVNDYELIASARDGTHTFVSLNATTFFDRSRTLQGVFASARDVTETKRIEAELKASRDASESASQTKSAFLASMSHEIRTPMNAIMGIADLLAKTTLSPEQDEYVQIFRRSGQKLLNLINDILDLSKVEASQLELEHSAFSLNERLKGVMELVRPLALEKGLTLSCDIALDVVNDLVGDAARLEQILFNLLGNAIKFTQTGGVSLRITRVADSARGATLKFVISDTGIGIAPEKVAGVFERFTQAESSTTRVFGGSGLGLTISRQLVELMGGHISCVSVPGQGSVFTFTASFDLPTSAAKPEVVTGQSHPDTAPPGLKPLRILMVEDSPDNRAITLAYLKDTPYRTDAAVTGAIGCEMFTTGQYDLVLMDRQMPVMDGLTATRAMRAWEKTNGRRPTPIIALTASALKGDREICVAAGCTAYLSKPIKQDVLLRAISDYAAEEPPSLQKVGMLVDAEAPPVVIRPQSDPQYLQTIAGRTFSRYRQVADQAPPK